MTSEERLIKYIESSRTGDATDLLREQPELANQPLSTEGDFALHIAAWQGEEELVALLLRMGAMVNARGDRGRTPLHYAAEQGNVGICMQLLSAGADPVATDANGATALEVADRASSKLLEVLHEAERDSARNRMPPFDAAIAAISRVDDAAFVGAVAQMRASGDTPSMTKMLFELMSAIDSALIKEMFGSYPFSKLEKLYEMLRLILEAGADPDGGRREGLSPLHYAVQQSNPRAAELLLRYGANPRQRGDGDSRSSVAEVLSRNPEAHLFRHLALKLD